MAVDLFSENNSSMSPRISFSHDLNLSDVVPVEQRRSLGSNSTGRNPSIDFDFCTRESIDQDSSSADELFLDGKLLPIEIKPKPPLRSKGKTIQQPRENHHPGPPKNPQERKATGSNNGDRAYEKQNSKSFWKFKRSNSLNCGSGYARTLCPIPLLSRSNSTGSAASSSIKNSGLSKESHLHKQHSVKHHQSGAVPKPSLPPPLSTGYQKPPLRKGHGPHASGIHVNPVLNVPSGNLFGLGSIFSCKNNKK